MEKTSKDVCNQNKWWHSLSKKSIDSLVSSLLPAFLQTHLEYRKIEMKDKNMSPEDLLGIKVDHRTKIVPPRTHKNSEFALAY